LLVSETVTDPPLQITIKAWEDRRMETKATTTEPTTVERIRVVRQHLTEADAALMALPSRKAVSMPDDGMGGDWCASAGPGGFAAFCERLSQADRNGAADLASRIRAGMGIDAAAASDDLADMF
jgi:hypothetical protein